MFWVTLPGQERKLLKAFKLLCVCCYPLFAMSKIHSMVEKEQISVAAIHKITCYVSCIITTYSVAAFFKLMLQDNLADSALEIIKNADRPI